MSETNSSQPYVNPESYLNEVQAVDYSIAQSLASEANRAFDLHRDAGAVFLKHGYGGARLGTLIKLSKLFDELNDEAGRFLPPLSAFEG